MRIDENEPIFTQTDATTILDMARLVTEYRVGLDERGVAENLSVSSGEEVMWPPTEGTYFYLVNGDENEDKVLAVNNCDDYVGDVSIRSSSGAEDTDAIFYYEDQKIYSLKCPGRWLAFETPTKYRQQQSGYYYKAVFKNICKGRICNSDAANGCYDYPVEGIEIKLNPLVRDSSTVPHIKPIYHEREFCDWHCTNSECNKFSDDDDDDFYCYYETFDKWEFAGSRDNPRIQTTDCTNLMMNVKDNKLQSCGNDCGTGAKWTVKPVRPHRQCARLLAGVRQCDKR